MTGVSAIDRTASRHTPIGEAGRNVIANVERLREARHLSLRGLSGRLGDLGHPMLPSAVHALVQGKRKVNADDLVALAAALEVSPGTLLAPPSAEEIPAEPHPAQREVRSSRAASRRCSQALVTLWPPRG